MRSPTAAPRATRQCSAVNAAPARKGTAPRTLSHSHTTRLHCWLGKLVLEVDASKGAAPSKRREPSSRLTSQRASDAPLEAHHSLRSPQQHPARGHRTWHVCSTERRQRRATATRHAPASATAVQGSVGEGAGPRSAPQPCAQTHHAVLAAVHEA